MSSSEQAKSRPNDPYSQIRLWLMAGAGALALLAIVFGSLPIKLVAGVLALCVIQGLWRGAAELIGIVAGMIVGVILCRPIGRLFEPLIASLTSTSGLLSRLLSVGLAALIVTAIAAVIISLLAKRFMKTRPNLANADKLAGGGLGLVEGCFLGLIILWIPLAMEPVAIGQTGRGSQANSEQTDEDGTTTQIEPRNPVAEAVVRFAEEVKGSSLGGVAESTNPMEGAKIFGLAGDFALVMRHKAAREHFVNSNAIRSLQDTPSVHEAIAQLEGDPELEALIRSGNYGPEFVRHILTSRTIVDVLDQTTIIEDLGPQVAEIEKALQEAKKIASPDSK